MKKIFAVIAIIASVFFSNGCSEETVQPSTPESGAPKLPQQPF